MPEEQKDVPAPSPEQAASPATPEQTSATAQSTAAASPPAKKKTNGCVIAVIVVAVIIVLSGLGIYLVLRFVKDKVDDTIKIDGDSTSVNIGDTQGSVSTGGDDYDSTTEQTPTVALIRQVGDDIKPILAGTMGGAKTSAWSSLDASSGSLTYVTKNPISSSDYAEIKSGLVNAGYTLDTDYSSSDSSMVSAVKDSIQIVIYMSTDEGSSRNVTVTVSQETATETE